MNSFRENFVCSDDISKDTTSPALDEIKCLPLSITLKTIQVLWMQVANIHDNQFVNAFSRKIVVYFLLSAKVQERQFCFSPEMPGVEMEEEAHFFCSVLCQGLALLGILIYRERGSSSRFHILVCLILWAFQGRDNWCSSSISLTNILKEKLGFSVTFISLGSHLHLEFLHSCQFLQ